MTTETKVTLSPWRVVAFATVALWLFIAAFPFVWTFWGSFKVQADFLSKADWSFAITGVNTIAQTGAAFTADGYQGAWIEEGFGKT